MRFLFIMATIAIVTLVGCVTQPIERSRISNRTERPCCRSVEPAPSRTAIVRTAAKLVGAKTIESNGRRIAYDCAGVTRAVFLKHGIDLYGGEPSDPQANGVRLIHAHIRKEGTFHQGPVVQPGESDDPIVLELFANRPHQNGQTMPPQEGVSGGAPRLPAKPLQNFAEC